MNVLLNRSFKKAEDGSFDLPADGYYHVVPKGTFQHSSGVKELVDEKAVQSICNRFAADAKSENFPGILVDFDHFSQNPDKPSAAAGWIEAVQPRSDGVYAKIRWSNRGEEAVKGGQYRLVSPVFKGPDCERAGDKTVRPLRLATLAITNDPQMKGSVPLSNRENNHNHEQRKNMSWKVKLGVPEDAGDDAVLAAVTSLQNRASTAETRVGTLEQANQGLLESQVEADLTRYSNRFKAEAKPKWKALLLSNRASAIELLESLQTEASDASGGAVQGALHNRAAAKTPNAGAGERDPATAAGEVEKLICEVMLSNRCRYEEAYNSVRMRRPELFGL